MRAFELNVAGPVNLEMTGKFVAPSSDWIHLSRILQDYELIIMTEGVLYLAGDDTRYTLSKGEYLLFPPYTRQYGYKASGCSFYWLHFKTAGGPVITDSTGHTADQTDNRLLLPQYGTVKSLEKIIVMMKQLQDSVRSYNQKTLNNYMTTVILCELYNQVFQNEHSPVKKRSRSSSTTIL